MKPLIYKAHVLRTARQHYTEDVENFLAVVPAADLLYYAQQLGARSKDGKFTPVELARFIRTEEFGI